MFYSTLLLAASALVNIASAQYNYSTSGPQTIDVSQIPAVQLQSWCLAQRNSCPQICGGTASENNCDPTTLDYTCTCANGNKPNISSYEQTVPYFICVTWIANCVDWASTMANNLQAVTNCRSVTCGMKNASAADSNSNSQPSSSSAASSSATASMSGSATASSASAAATSSGAAVMNVAMNYGTGILAAGMLGVFGLAL